MIMFLELHDNDDGEKILCNVSHIQRMFPSGSGTRLIMVGSEYDYFAVEESYDEICERIRKMVNHDQ